MMGLGAPIGPKFRNGAIWGAKPSPFGATRWTRGDVYQELGYDYGAGILDLLVAENADHPELRAALPGEQTFTGMIKEQH